MPQERRIIIARLRFACLIAFAILVATAPAFADVTFFDGNFSPANYTQTTSFVTAGATLIAGSQCSGLCGNPDPALQIDTYFGDTTLSLGSADLGFVNTTFSYDPSTQGAILSITASVDKNLTVDVTPTTASGTLGDTFRPLIYQDLTFYLAAIPYLPGVSIVGGTGSTGFQTLSQSGLVAADFLQYDFSTGTFYAGTPNFAGDPMLFGLGQISSLQGYSSGHFAAVYDNLQLDLATVPEPSSILLMGTLLLGVAGALKRKLT